MVAPVDEWTILRKVNFGTELSLKLIQRVALRIPLCITNCSHSKCVCAWIREYNESTSSAVISILMYAVHRKLRATQFHIRVNEAHFLRARLLWRKHNVTIYLRLVEQNIPKDVNCKINCRISIFICCYYQTAKQMNATTEKRERKKFTRMNKTFQGFQLNSVEIITCVIFEHASTPIINWNVSEYQWVNIWLYFNLEPIYFYSRLLENATFLFTYEIFASIKFHPSQVLWTWALRLFLFVIILFWI